MTRIFFIYYKKSFYVNILKHNCFPTHMAVVSFFHGSQWELKQLTGVDYQLVTDIWRPAWCQYSTSLLSGLLHLTTCTGATSFPSPYLLLPTSKTTSLSPSTHFPPQPFDQNTSRDFHIWKKIHTLPIQNQSQYVNSPDHPKNIKTMFSSHTLYSFLFPALFICTRVKYSIISW